MTGNNPDAPAIRALRSFPYSSDERAPEYGVANSPEAEAAKFQLPTEGKTVEERLATLEREVGLLRQHVATLLNRR